ncbi:hypothetical protein BG000_007247 [Podila horticola]|nr:hypothetical protein BG000_007247 [Podila horticola]
MYLLPILEHCSQLDNLIIRGQQIQDTNIVWDQVNTKPETRTIACASFRLVSFEAVTIAVTYGSVSNLINNCPDLRSFRALVTARGVSPSAKKARMTYKRLQWAAARKYSATNFKVRAAYIVLQDQSLLEAPMIRCWGQVVEDPSLSRDWCNMPEGYSYFEAEQKTPICPLRALRNLNSTLYLIVKHFDWKEAAAPSRSAIVVWKDAPPYQLSTTNCRSIQSAVIYIQADPKRHTSIQFTCLTKLEVTGTIGSSKASSWILLAQLIRRNKNLEEIRLTMQCQDVPLEFWASFASCPKIKTVHLDFPKMDQSMINALWSGCRNLRQLAVNEITFHGVRVPVFFSDHIGILPNMERLEVTFGQEVSSPALDQELLLRSCPNLRAVLIDSKINGHTPLSVLATILRDGNLQHLEELEVRYDFEDEALAACLQAMRQASKIMVGNHGFGELSFLSLMPHFHTLRELQLGKIHNIPGYMIQTVLESCPLPTAI